MAGKRNILIVDDDAEVLNVVGRILSAAGYSVLSAHNGKEGVLAAKNKIPDLVLLDVDMPVMDGGEVRQILGDDPKTRHIPIIYLTGLMTQGEAEKRETGRNVFLAKPVDAAELLRAIQEQLK